MYIYIYIYTYIHTHIHMHICIYTLSEARVRAACSIKDEAYPTGLRNKPALPPTARWGGMKGSNLLEW